MDASLIGVGISTVGSLIIASNDANERRKLEEKIAKLTLAQQKELEIRLQNSKTDIEKMQILYQALAMDKNRDALSKLNQEKYTGIAIFGVSLILLSIVIIIVKQHKS